MECQICRRRHRPQLHHRHPPQPLPLLCPVDARNLVYPARFDILQLLLENDQLRSRIDALGPDADDPSAAQLQLLRDRSADLHDAAHRLRPDVEAAREEVRSRKEALARRRSDLASLIKASEERQPPQLGEAQESIRSLRSRCSQLALDLSRTRAFLCAEAAKLYGLRRIKTADVGRYDYQLARLSLINLASMDSATPSTSHFSLAPPPPFALSLSMLTTLPLSALSPDLISSSLAHVSHLLILISHYLALRLPAEITRPHRHYPRPTIFSLSGSYQPRGSSPTAPPSVSRSSSRPGEADQQPVHRPRPLYLDKALPQLSKDDPAAFSLFLEGVALLAYDVAWLCACQGVPVGDKGSFEDVCHIGRNLYAFLLCAQRQGVADATRDAKSRHPSTRSPRDPETAPSAIRVGQYSHGTASNFLGGLDGTQLVRSSRLPNPIKVADRLRHKLLSDAPAVDWELLEEDAWKVEPGPSPDGAPSGTWGLVDWPKDGQEKVPTKAGSKGWTRVKQR